MMQRILRPGLDFQEMTTPCYITKLSCKSGLGNNGPGAPSPAPKHVFAFPPLFQPPSTFKTHLIDFIVFNAPLNVKNTH